jgi:flagellar biosynthetic protein FliQ
MDPQFVIDLTQEWMWTGLMIGTPILLAGVVIGMIIALLQALTQVQEQTIAIVLKIIVMILVAGYTMPWMTNIVVERATDIFHSIPRIIPG